MIDAKAAKALSEVGENKMEEILWKLDKDIREEASKGSRKHYCYNSVPWESFPYGASPKNTLVQDAVIEKLKSFGYKAVMT